MTGVTRSRVSGYGVVGIDYTVKHIAVRPYPEYDNLQSLCGRFGLRKASLPHQLRKPTCQWCLRTQSAGATDE